MGERQPPQVGTVTLLMEKPDTRTDDSTLESERERHIEEQFSAGAEPALEMAYARYGRLVYSVAARSLDRDAAADVTQETFVAAWRAHHRFDRDRGSLAGWLVAIARNKVIDEIRRRARRPMVVRDETGVEPAAPESDIEAMADRMLVAEALDTLPERARLSVELAFLEGYSHAAIADHTGMALGTVKSDIRRGLDRMRRYLEVQDG